MRRRELLALAAGGLAATAGCLGDSRDPARSDGPADDGTGDDSRTDRSTATATETSTATDAPETPEPTDVREVSVDSLQPGLIELGTPDSITLSEESRGQYLFLAVTGGENPPARSEFTFELGGTDYAPVEKTRGLWRSYNEDESAQYQPSSPGWLLFELPASVNDLETAQLRWPGGSWEPSEAIRERLATLPPSFDVSLDIPETVPVDQTSQMAVTIENTGDVVGRFLMAVNRVGPSVAYAPESAVRTLLQPVEREQWILEPSFDVDPGDTTRLKFDWFGGSAEREVEFVEATSG